MKIDLRARVHDLIEALNAHDLDRVASFYAPHFVGKDIAQADLQRGPGDRRRVLAAYIRALPDVQFAGDAVVDGDRAAVIWTMRGTHRGRLMRIPPTGRAVEVRGVSVLQFEDGLIVRGENIWDLAGLLRAMGLLPQLQALAAEVEIV